MAPISTEYELQCWGAQGQGQTGGKGGYAVGKATYTAGTILYICVGGYNNYYNNQIENLTSFNWGGHPGGGATSITTSNRGELKNFKNCQSEVIMVAGGGGGCEWIGTGGAGGGINGLSGSKSTYLDGNPTSYSYGLGGSQANGGSYNKGYYTPSKVYGADFGVGGIGAATMDGITDYGAQGGGGWYGGGGSVYAGAAGGGSGHVNEDPSLLTSAKTTAGNESFPSVDGKNNETGHTGDGACLITQTSF